MRSRLPPKPPSSGRGLTKEEKEYFELQKLPPLRKGHVRGVVESYTYDTHVEAIGEVTTWRFVVQPTQPDKNAPPFTLVMTGINILPRPRAGLLIEVEWVDTPDRTIHVNRALMPQNGDWLQAFTLEQAKLRNPRAEWTKVVLFIVCPLIAVFTVVFLLWWSGATDLAAAKHD